MYESREGIKNWCKLKLPLNIGIMENRSKNNLPWMSTIKFPIKQYYAVVLYNDICIWYTISLVCVGHKCLLDYRWK